MLRFRSEPRVGRSHDERLAVHNSYCSVGDPDFGRVHDIVIKRTLLFGLVDQNTRRPRSNRQGANRVFENNRIMSNYDTHLEVQDAVPLVVQRLEDVVSVLTNIGYGDGRHEINKKKNYK